jgi:hypothetical protein
MSRHRIGSRSSLARAAGSLALLLALAPAAARAQGSGFLLGTPMGSLSIRGGYDHANAGSDIFNDPSTTGQLTLQKSDFSSPSLAVDLGVRISDRFDFILGSAYAGVKKGSHYRNFTEGADNKEIEQTTAFQRVPITGSFRMYLASRGRSVGKFAWIPNKVAPYVGGGGGLMWYRFRQAGDFIDFSSANSRIYTAATETSNWTPEAHAFAGLDYTINPRLALTGETRYTWGRGPISSDYVGFHRIDLSGIAASAGLAVRF